MKMRGDVNSRLLELREQRGVLRTQCAAQRQAIADHVQPLLPWFSRADQVRSGMDWLRQNPLVLGIGLAALVLVKPARAWRWGRKGLVLWQLWRSVRQRIESL